jgi:hypothetical protein
VPFASIVPRLSNRDSDWPKKAEREETIPAFVAAFAASVFLECSRDDLPTTRGQR